MEDDSSFKDVIDRILDIWFIFMSSYQLCYLKIWIFYLLFYIKVKFWNDLGQIMGFKLDAKNLVF